MPDEIVLDKKTFEALAIDTRVSIMKALKQRRKTQSELSHELKLAVSTVAEHLTKMSEAGLVVPKKQGKKWVYYELTDKGTQILSPRIGAAFVFALSISILMIVMGSMTLFTQEALMVSNVALDERSALQQQSPLLNDIFGIGAIQQQIVSPGGSGEAAEQYATSDAGQSKVSHNNSTAAGAEHQTYDNGTGVSLSLQKKINTSAIILVCLGFAFLSALGYTSRKKSL